MRPLLRFAPMIAAAALAGPAIANTLFDSAPLSDAELEAARGGFDLPDGVKVDFGVLIHTRVDGVPVLQTEFQVVGNQVQMATSAPGATTSDRSLSAAATLPDFLVQHEVGQQISSLIVNTADGRVIDNQLSINLRLDNVQPLALGGTGFRIQSLGLDAALWRASGG